MVWVTHVQRYLPIPLFPQLENPFSSRKRGTKIGLLNSNKPLDQSGETGWMKNTCHSPYIVQIGKLITKNQ